MIGLRVLWYIKFLVFKKIIIIITFWYWLSVKYPNHDPNYLKKYQERLKKPLLVAINHDSCLTNIYMCVVILICGHNYKSLTVDREGMHTHDLTYHFCAIRLIVVNSDTGGSSLRYGLCLWRFPIMDPNSSIIL